jgi:cytochrome P450
VRPEILLTDDPPRHTEVRRVMAQALSPRILNEMSATFRAVAEAQVGRLMEREGETIDAVADITRPFVHQVLPDVIGLAQEGRENMSAFGHAVWATMGPPNALYNEAVEGAGPVVDWAERACSRENLDPDGIGMLVYQAADRGEVTQDEAKLLVLTMLAAGADTTVVTMATAIRAFSEFPDEWQKLRKDPSLVRNAFDESLRWDSPSRMAGRITTQDIEFEGHAIPAGTRCGLLFAAANRDPRKWKDPDRFDVNRDRRGHVGWGFGIHACVGRVLAQLEADALIGALIRHVERFEAAGEPEWWMTTIGHGPYKLPIRLVGTPSVN